MSKSEERAKSPNHHSAGRSPFFLIHSQLWISVTNTQLKCASLALYLRSVKTSADMVAMKFVGTDVEEVGKGHYPNLGSSKSGKRCQMEIKEIRPLYRIRPFAETVAIRCEIEYGLNILRPSTSQTRDRKSMVGGTLAKSTRDFSGVKVAAYHASVFSICLVSDPAPSECRYPVPMAQPPNEYLVPD
jgi:hypothetical protein